MDEGRNWEGALPPVGWMLAALASARLEAVVEWVPVMGLLRGPLGLVVLILGIAVSLSRLFSRPATPPETPLDRDARTPSVRVLFALSFLLVAGIGIHYTDQLRVSGDEPHYLIMAQSLWREHDLDLRDNYAREDWKEYTPGPVTPHYGAPRNDGRPYPAHSPGLPVLLAPVYAAAGRRAVVLLLAFMASALGLEARRLALAAGASEAGARFAWALALGPPALFYGFHVYTELPSALALAFALRVLSTEPPPGAAARAALAVCALPWLHVKMIPAAVVLGVIAIVRLRGASRRTFLAVAVAGALAFVGYYQAVFGRPTPLALYGGVPRDLGGEPWRALLGLLLDRSFGLLPHAPLFVLALASLPWWRGRASGLPHVALVVALVLPLLGWRMWWGGQCPPARFLVPVVPLLGVPLAMRLSGDPRGLARWRFVLLAAGLGLALFMIARPGDLLLVNRGDRPTRVWVALSTGTQVARYLPSLVANDPEETRVALVWVALLGSVLVLDRLAQRRPDLDRWFRGMALPLALFLVGGTAIDRWARAGSPPAPASVEIGTP